MSIPARVALTAVNVYIIENTLSVDDAIELTERIAELARELLRDAPVTTAVAERLARSA